MRIVPCQDTAFYRPRQPWDSPLYRLVEEHFEEFERVYPDRFQARYGFWRPVIRTAVLDYLLTMPKRFRIYFRFNRELLRKLPRSDLGDGLGSLPGCAGAKRHHPRHGRGHPDTRAAIELHPHIHALTTYGAFTPDGTFIPLPDDL